MNKLRRSARLSAASPGEANSSRASSSTSEAERLPCDHFQAEMQKLSKDRMLTDTQLQLAHTPVLQSSNRANLPSETNPVAFVATSATKPNRSPVLAKRVYKRNTVRDAADMRQRRHDERLGNNNLKATRRGVFQGRKRNNQVSSSKSHTKNSANSNHNARSHAAEVSEESAEESRAARHEIRKRYLDCREFMHLASAKGNNKVLRYSRDWKLNWSCSLMTHDTDILPNGWRSNMYS